MRKQEIESFQRYITIWYQKYGRHTLPWRLTTDPYAILVSELMLQQTQVSRVIPKYKVFLKRFPNLKSLKSSSLADVLIFWQGLGYNRRAKYLWQLAKTTQILPSSQVELEKLPGIGPYTASAICAFAFNQPTPMIETNIRSVFLYHFFPDQKNVSDRDLVPLVSSAVDQSNPRRWYWALMDYGSYLKTIL
ncbi:MAG TPA: A/G-specific adenine glycosylase, partial [Candidatus Woesebacteria bacterium]|nr:A/G-specific adenine glycosylase [Candidatus Woesebacteria bacterium]